MADTNYQPKVYLLRGSDEQVIADGGQETVESGGEIEVNSGGQIEVESGGKIDMESGSEFQFYSTDFTADKMENFMLSFQTRADYASAAAGAVLSVSALKYNYGYHLFSGATGLVDGSVTLTAGDSGCILYLDGAHLVGNGNVSFHDGAAISILNRASTLLSGFAISAAGWCRMVCLRANEWAIMEGNILEFALA